MIQIRNVPDDVHRTLKMRAAEAGMSLSDYLLREIQRTADQPTLAEIIARIKKEKPFRPKEDSVAVIRKLRDGE